MKLKEFIEKQLESMAWAEIKSAEFCVCLDGNGTVVRESMTTIRFTLTLK